MSNGFVLTTDGWKHQPGLFEKLKGVRRNSKVSGTFRTREQEGKSKTGRSDALFRERQGDGQTGTLIPWSNICNVAFSNCWF